MLNCDRPQARLRLARSRASSLSDEQRRGGSLSWSRHEGGRSKVDSLTCVISSSGDGLASCNLVGPGLWCDSSDAQLGDELEVEVVLAAGVDADMSRERRRECESARTSGAWPVRTDPSFTR